MVQSIPPPDTVVYKDCLFSWLPSCGASAPHQRKLRAQRVTIALILLISYRY